MKIKNILGFWTTIALLLFATSSLISQTENTDKRISIGFEGGIQFTKIYDSQAYSNLPKSKTGFSAGFFGDYKFSELIKARIGLYYDNRGFINQDVLSPISETQGDSDYVSYGSYFATDMDYTLNYLTIPLSIFYTKGTDKLSFFLQGSIYYSILISAHRTGFTDLYIYPDHASEFENPELQNPGSTITEYNNEDVYNSFNGNDWGVQLFFGAIYHINPNLSLQFSPGFTIAFGDLYADPLRNSKWSSIYKINAGIIYKIK